MLVLRYGCKLYCRHTNTEVIAILCNHNNLVTQRFPSLYFLAYGSWLGQFFFVSLPHIRRGIFTPGNVCLNLALCIDICRYSVQTIPMNLHSRSIFPLCYAVCTFCSICMTICVGHLSLLFMKSVRQHRCMCHQFLNGIVYWGNIVWLLKITILFLQACCVLFWCLRWNVNKFTDVL